MVVHGSVPEPYVKNVWVHVYPENTVHSATIIGVDRIFDVAVLKVNLTNRVHFNWSDSRDLKVASPIAALGQPYGDHVQSITVGVTRENKGQDFSWMPESVISDFDTVGGNSGGPVINVSGDVVGILSWGYGDSTYQISGAIASHLAKQISDNIISRHLSGGTPPLNYASSYLGVNFSPINMYNTLFTIPALSRVEGVRVISVANGSPAKSAGLKAGDVITHANGIIVGKNNNQFPLGTIVHFTPRGGNIALTVRRTNNGYGNPVTINVTTTAIPGGRDIIFSNVQTIGKLLEGEMEIHV